MPSLFIADQLALSLFSMGYTSGLSFSSGFKSTQAGVVYEGHILPHTVKQLDIAGYQLTENLKKLLMSLKGFGFRSSSQWQIVDDIKKKMGFFSLGMVRHRQVLRVIDVAVCTSKTLSNNPMKSRISSLCDGT